VNAANPRFSSIHPPARTSEMLEAIARALVDHPDDVRIEETGSAATAVFILHVHADDVGKIIGRQGRTIHTIRDLLDPIAAKTRRRILFDVYDPAPRRQNQDRRTQGA
jgi:uncharacterized protein